MVDVVVETLNSLGEMINSLYHRSVVEVDDGNIIAIDPRMRLVFDGILNPRKRLKKGSHLLNSETEAAWQYNASHASGVSANGIMKAHRTLKRASELEEGGPRSAGRTRAISQSRLPQLLTVLYFRAKGYVVQRVPGARGGGDDLVVWKSSMVDKLVGHGLIGNGCLIDEVAHARELGRVENAFPDYPRDSDLAFVGIATSVKEATKDDGAMNRLLGLSWSLSEPKIFKDGLRSLAVANRLYAAFPMIHVHRQSYIGNIEDLMTQFEQRQPDREKVGLVVWGPRGFLHKESSDFPHELQAEQIEKYEMNIKRSLLENFQLHELFDFMEKLEVEFCRDGEDQILWEFEEKIKRVDVDVILAELIELMDRRDEDPSRFSTLSS